MARSQAVVRREPTLTLLGDLPLVTSLPIHRLHRATQGRVDRIGAAMAAGEHRVATGLALALERDQGITAEERIAAMRPTEAWETMQATAAAKAGAKSAKAAKVELPDTERGRSQFDIRRFDKALKGLTKVDRQGRPPSVEQLDVRLKALSAIEREPVAAAEKKWLQCASEETRDLEAKRGGQTEQLPSGAIRANDRDGLYQLLRIKQPLTAEQYDAGMAFRAGWELRSIDVGSGMGGTGGTGHDNDRYVEIRFERAKKLAHMSRVERQVALACIEQRQPEMLSLLRRVAGDGLSLTSFGKGAAYDKNLKALKAALDVAHQLSR